MKKFLVIVWLFLSWWMRAQNTTRETDSLQSIIRTSADKAVVLTAKSALLLEYFRHGRAEQAEKLYIQSVGEAFSEKLDKPLALLYHTRGTMYYYASLFDSALF